MPASKLKKYEQLLTGMPGVRYSDASSVTGTETGSGTGSEIYIPTYEEYYNNALSSIEANRQKQITDATASAAQMGASYGTRAESLGAMGLTGSGYSDYLSGKAYQTGRQAISDINANAEANRLNQQGLYRQYLDAQEAQRKTAYETLLTNAGTYDLDTLSALMDSRGLDDTQRLNVYNAALGSGSYTIPQLTALKNKYRGADNQSTNPTLTGAIDAAMQSIYDNASISDNLFIDSAGERLARSDAEKVLNNIKNTYGESTEVDSPYQKALSQFNNLYGVTKSKSGLRYLRGDFNNSPDAGDNIKVKDEDGNKYKVEFAGESSADAYNAATSNGIEDGQVFKYGLDYYIIYGGTAQKIRRRNVVASKKKNFNKMVEAF